MPNDEVINEEARRLESMDLKSLYSQLQILIKQITRCILEIGKDSISLIVFLKEINFIEFLFIKSF